MTMMPTPPGKIQGHIQKKKKRIIRRSNLESVFDLIPPFSIFPHAHHITHKHADTWSLRIYHCSIKTDTVQSHLHPSFLTKRCTEKVPPWQLWNKAVPHLCTDCTRVPARVYHDLFNHSPDGILFTLPSPAPQPYPPVHFFVCFSFFHHHKNALIKVLPYISWHTGISIFKTDCQNWNC